MKITNKQLAKEIQDRISGLLENERLETIIDTLDVFNPPPTADKTVRVMELANGLYAFINRIYSGADDSNEWVKLAAEFLSHNLPDTPKPSRYTSERQVPYDVSNLIEHENFSLKPPKSNKDVLEQAKEIAQKAFKAYTTIIFQYDGDYPYEIGIEAMAHIIAPYLHNTASHNFPMVMEVYDDNDGGRLPVPRVVLCKSKFGFIAVDFETIEQFEKTKWADLGDFHIWEHARTPQSTTFTISQEEVDKLIRKKHWLAENVDVEIINRKNV